MGFDNECIVNIQSLAGEYFCPVCRLLIYPNEALQSQCTHLYCKPCLTYIVSTTRACPYDGYLVTEADSKPLTESNKTLAEAIGKIAVHCLYHRSGCTWQGTLSECTSHCSGCAFGNSPVVCNRCGIQIVHRQVQEHAQNCAGVQGQVQQEAATQDPSASSATVSIDQNQTATPVGTMDSQAQMSQTVVTTTTPGQVPNQLTNPASHSQPLAQAGVQPTAEQWYQQQQYQQYYQQYSGQDPYQQQYQHYYPYQHSVVPQYQQAYAQPQPQSQSQPQAQHQSQPQPQVPHQSQPQLQSQPQAQGLSQPHVQAPVAPQSQNQMQVHQQQQQLQPAVPPHSQIQSLTHPPSHCQALPQPQVQPYPYPQVQPHSVQPQPQQQMQMPPYQQPHPQLQHSQPQVQQPIQKYPVPQPQVNTQLQPHAPVQHLSQPQMHPHQPLTPNVQPHMQNAPLHAVTGHHSYPQPQLQQNMQLGAPQHTIHMRPQSGPQLQQQHSVQIQNQFPQQSPVMRPHHSHAIFPNQQQPALLPSPVQSQSFPPLQQQQVFAHNQQPGQINQCPVSQPVQQMLLPFPQQQMPVPSHIRPQGPAHSFPKNTLAHPQSQGNVSQSDSTQHIQSQNAVGPLIPNHAVRVHPFAQSTSTNPVRPMQISTGQLPENQNLLVGTNNQVKLSSELQSGAPESVERQGGVIEQQTNSTSGKHVYTVSGSATDLKSSKVETDMKQTEVGKKQNGEDPHTLKTLGSNANALENGDSVNQNLGKGKAAESTWLPLSGNKSGATTTGVQNNSINEYSAVKGSEIQDGRLRRSSSVLSCDSESQTDKLPNDDTCTLKPPSGAENALNTVSQPHGTRGTAIDEYRGMHSGVFAQPSRPGSYTDQGKHQQPMINYGPAAVQQRSSALSALQLPHPALPNQPLAAGHSSTLRNPGPAHSLCSVQPLNSTENFQPMFKQPQGSDIQYDNPGRSFKPHSLGHPGPYNQGLEPPFHVGVSNLSRIGEPQFGPPPPGDMHGGMAANMPLHAPEGFGFQDERLKALQVPVDLREFEDDLKKFPRLPLDAEPISKFGSHSGSTLHPGFLGAGPGYGRHHADGMTPRSPVGEYAEMSSRRSGPFPRGLVSKSDMDDYDGRDACHFGDSVGIAFRDSRFPHLPSHLHRNEFEGFGNLPIGEHSRSGDFIGPDVFGGHFQRGEHLGPPNFSRHLQLGEPLAFGAHPSHMREVELSGARSFESFSRGNRLGHPRLGEPGFRSSFSLSGFPNDAGFIAGDNRPFDDLRMRLAATIGWCRICKVDCETVEGLDLHSQTREHQKIAMDIVKSIKQKSKKPKVERSSVEDGHKSRKTGLEGRGNKH